MYRFDQSHFFLANLRDADFRDATQLPFSKDEAEKRGAKVH